MHAIIPTPAEFTAGTGSFLLGRTHRVFTDSSEAGVFFPAMCIADILRRITGHIVEPEIFDGLARPERAVFLSVDDRLSELGPEGYELDVLPDRVQIASSGHAGLFYGVQSLRQWIGDPTEMRSADPERAVPCVHIRDQPRFAWRGFMLDTSRSFFPLAFLKRYVDLLTYYKINRFHLHLTDDHGWRMEIRNDPELTEKGAWRQENGNRRGGYYTQDELRDFVEYASARHVTVVPEIDMPGHCTAALTAHPELSCTGGPFELWTEPGISEDPYCAGNDQTFVFLERVLEQVLDVFPSEYVHLGGDEASTKRWERCERCRARMREEGLDHPIALQAWFLRRMCRFLQERGRFPIVWDDVVKGGIPEGSTVMYWQDGTENHRAALRAGHNVIMAPTSHCYFDYKQRDAEAEPGHIGVVPLEQAYGFEPMPGGIADVEKARILGGQANAWTELMKTPDRVDFMVFPRLCALAESVWSDLKDKNWRSFEVRARSHESFFEAAGVRARPMDLREVSP